MQNQTQTLFKTGKPANALPENAAGYIYVTKDYLKFKHLVGNRPLNKLHLRRLKDSMLKKYLRTICIINEKYEVIDGQHRIEVCKELMLPVYYTMIKGYGLAEVQIFNSNVDKWSVEATVAGAIELGLKDYELYDMFRKQFHLDHLTALALLTGSQEKTIIHKFRNGEFVIGDYKTAMKNAEKLKAVGQFYKGFHRRFFIMAMLKCFRNKDYDHSLFIRKLAYQSTKLVNCPDTAMYLSVIEDIYNHRNENKINLRVDIDNNRSSDGKFKSHAGQ